MFEKIEKLILELNAPTSLLHDWKQLVQRGYDESFIQEWLAVCKSKTECILLTAFLKDLQVSGLTQEALYKSIDDSAYHSRQWAEATIFLLTSDPCKEVPNDAAHAFGYLCCCAESSQQTLLALKFSDLVQEMLDQFGYDGPE